MSEENTNLTTEQTDTLLQFQDIAQIESIEECRHLLEACNWDIGLALQNKFNDTQETPRTPPGAEDAALHQEFMDQIRNFNQNPPTNNAATTARNNNLPAVNILTQRTFSYYNQELAPRGLLQWGYFLIAFPIRFFYSTIIDTFSYFCSFFGSNENNNVNTNVNYDPLANIAEFIIDFNRQYGADNHPNFFEGSYAQAVTHAKRDLRFLLVYLHENDNSDCKKFSEETLGNRQVIDFINNNLMFWACSRNLPEGKKVFSALRAKRSPFLGVIVLRNNKMTLVTRMEGPITATELVPQLNSMIQDFEAELIAVRNDREALNQTQLLRVQQDQAYAESLRLDQEKARKQRDQENAKKQEIEEQVKREEEEKRRQNNIIGRKAELKKKFENEIIDASCENSIKLLVKLPSGRRLERIFLKTDPVKDLYNFVFSNDECPTNFEIVTNFPRKVIEASDTNEKSLAESGINQPMLLFVNDIDA